MLKGTYCLPTPASEALMRQMPEALSSFAARQWSKIASKEAQDWGYPSQRHAQSVRNAERFVEDLYQKMRQALPFKFDLNGDDDAIKELSEQLAAEYDALQKQYFRLADLFELSPPLGLEQRIAGERKCTGFINVIDFVKKIVFEQADSIARDAERGGIKINELLVKEVYELGVHDALVEHVRRRGFDVDVMFAFSRQNLTKEELEAECAVHVKKMCDPAFWRRQIRKMQTRGVENVYRAVGFVHAKKNLYVSDDSLRRYRSRKARTKALMQSLKLVNELGQEFSLEELSAVGISNPAIRRAELMVRISGFEYFAVSLGHAGEFVTLTCPSRFHSRHHVSGAENKKYDGSTPLDAVKYLGGVWAKIRAALKRADINVYGFRVVEPHHDGTPHWHCLFFMQKEKVDQFRRIFARYACEDSKRELGLYYQDNLGQAEIKKRADWTKYNQYAEANGLKRRALKEMPEKPSYQSAVGFWGKADYSVFHAVKSRVDFVSINWNKGTAAGYIAKYISKNIDGRTVMGDSVGGDFETSDLRDVTETAERVACWSSVYGIRQFQQIGGPPVTVWRELRRLDKNDIKDYEDVITRAAYAADAGDWGRFVEIMGGVEIRRKDRPVQLYKEKCELLTKYGEERPALICGVVEPETGLYKISRTHDWEVVLKTGGTAAAWTCVNNCTKSEVIDLKPRVDKGLLISGEAKINPDLYIIKKYNLFPDTVRKRFDPAHFSDSMIRDAVLKDLKLSRNCGEREALEIFNTFTPERLAREKQVLANYRNIRAEVSDEMVIELIKLKSYGRPSFRARDIEKAKIELCWYASGLLNSAQIEAAFAAQRESARRAEREAAYLGYLRLLEKILPSLTKETGIGLASKEPEFKPQPRVKKRVRPAPMKKPLTSNQLVELSSARLLRSQEWLAKLSERAL